MVKIARTLQDTFAGGAAGGAAASGLAAGDLIGGPAAWGLIGGSALLGGISSLFEEDDPAEKLGLERMGLENQLLEDRLEDEREARNKFSRMSRFWGQNMNSFMRGVRL